MRRCLFPTITLALAAGPAAAQEPPKPVPVTRPEIKRALEDLKQRQPRLPLPPPTAEELAAWGGRPPVNNARMRQRYLPEELRDARSGLGGSEPNMTLDGTFKTLLFWEVSRVNNCHYCLGHQEHKLAAAGVTDDRLAALDCDWSVFTPAERAAFAFTRKLTYEPFALTAADLDALRPHYQDGQILEIVLAVAGFNAMNRWTDSLGIPAEQTGEALLRAVAAQPGVNPKTFLTPTSAAYRDRPSVVAPLGGGTPGHPTAAALARRPPIESRAEVELKLAECGRRAPRLPLAGEADARKVLPATWGDGPPPNWVRLLAVFPRQGAGRVQSLHTAEHKGLLGPALRGQIAWVAARHDRAWYAVGLARRQLRQAGQSDDAIFALDGDWSSFSPAEREAFAFARKLTVAPQAITNDDVARLRAHYADQAVAEIVYRLTNAAFLNRVTEAAGLPLEQ